MSNATGNIASATKQELYAAVDEALGELEHAQRQFLTKTGWAYSSSHPDCVWRWSKTIDGRNYSLDVDGAIRMELSLDD